MNVRLQAVPDSNWFNEGAEPLCRLPLAPSLIATRLGLSAETAAGWQAIAAADGLILRLSAVADHPAQTAVTVRGDRRTPADALLPLCTALDLDPAQLPWLAADLSPRQWALARYDDNSNRFVMCYFRERVAAQAAADDYTARGHKQVYSVEPAE